MFYIVAGSTNDLRKKKKKRSMQGPDDTHFVRKGPAKAYDGRRVSLLAKV